MRQKIHLHGLVKQGEAINMSVPREMKHIRVLVGAFLTFLAFVLASAAFCAGVSQKIHFARHRTSTTIQQSVLRGERDQYVLRGRTGQKLKVSISSLEKNAAFQIDQPGRKKTLKGAGEEDDAVRWNGKLPVSGDYTIVVGSTRGNAEYKLYVALN
ncbi:MAG TPA: hypothetical protein VF600_02945 [Abditibacteriaceae bacterium]